MRPPEFLKSRTRFTAAYAIAATVFSLAWSAALGQSDPLVSKSISLLLADGDMFWAVAADGAHYSRIDPFANPPAIKNGTLPFGGLARGGVGRTVSILLFHDYLQSDSVTVGGIGAVGRDDKTRQDSLIFARHGLHKTATTLGAEISALALRTDTLIIGGGTAGIAYAKVKPEGQGALASDTLEFRALPDGPDSSVAAFRCAVNKICSVDSLDNVPKKFGTPDSVTALAVDSSASDSIWLLIGTHTGLRRGLLGGRLFPRVALPLDKPGTPIRIETIHADAAHNILWVFSGSEYFFSGDHGLTFHKPPTVAGVGTKPSSLTGFNPAPQAANDGDSTWINFNLDRPGLVKFLKDSITANTGTGDFGDVIIDAEDGLDIQRGEGRLTALATVRSGGVTALAAGSTFKGLFLRKTGAGQNGSWANINSLKALKNGLGEIITFPTLFTGVRASGDPDYVHIGYRLKKDGKVTIRVFNYAMEPVFTVVDHSPRKGGGSRSESPTEDRWDGRDSGGRPVSFGTYYILVESDSGEKGWGKAIAVRGRNP